MLPISEQSIYPLTLAARVVMHNDEVLEVIPEVIDNIQYKKSPY